MKSEKPTSKERIEHILNAVQIIQSFTEGYTLNDFEQDIKVYYACLYQYAVIGEAIVNIDNEFLQKYSYPWYKVRSFRNFIMHEYHAIDARVVWDTTRLVLPGFKNIIEEILVKEFN
jgi:uncharacterized protein with HEPN domain